MHSVNWEEILKETAEDGKALSHYLAIDLDDPKIRASIVKDLASLKRSIRH